MSLLAYSEWLSSACPMSHVTCHWSLHTRSGYPPHVITYSEWLSSACHCILGVVILRMSHVTAYSEWLSSACHCILGVVILCMSHASACLQIPVTIFGNQRKTKGKPYDLNEKTIQISQEHPRNIPGTSQEHHRNITGNPGRHPNKSWESQRKTMP